MGAETRAEIGSLHPRAVLAVGLSREALRAQLPRTRVVTRPAALPGTSALSPRGRLVVLVHRRSAAAVTAAVTSAQAAGAQVITVHGYDPRADPAAITALSAARPRLVIALGAGFGPAGCCGTAGRGRDRGQLPGSGQVLFPTRRLVALYGHPGTPALGALGQQDPPWPASRGLGNLPRSVPSGSSVPVIPAFEIIATVAEGSPGQRRQLLLPDPAGLTAAVGKARLSRRDVCRAGPASRPGQPAHPSQEVRGVPGAAQRRAGAGPEWKLQPGQRPLRQIGSVSAGEINSVSNWLASLTAQHHLPQKLLVLHQFRLSMLGNEDSIDTRHDELAIVIHMDGQGTPADKQQTWQAVTRAAPRHVFFGWKNFYTKDHPMLPPRQTMGRIPRPVMISYQ